MKNLKLFALAGVASVWTSAAFAADMPIETSIPVAPAYDWSGFWVGIHGGVAGGDMTYPFSVEDTTIPATLVDGDLELSSGGGFGGVGIGYDFQFSGGFILGAAADISIAAIDGDISADIDIGGGGPGIDAEAGSTLEWFGTVRGRIGYAWDRLLVYGTGGFAFGEIESGINASIGGVDLVDESIKTDHVGWTAGAGLEFAVTESISIKTEYLYVDLGDEEILTADLGGTEISLDVETQFHTLKAGLNVRF